MIDITKLRENPQFYRKATADKQFDPTLVDDLLKIDEKRKKLIGEIEALRGKRNKIAESKNIEEGKKVKDELKKREPELVEAEREYQDALNAIPNPALESVPVGKDDKEKVEVKKWGTPIRFDFEPLDHLELGKQLGIIDFETGAKVTGSQFYFLYGDGALLEMALIQYAFEKLSKEGFLPVITPDLAKSRYYLGTGYMPKGDEAQTYTIEGEDLGLIATAEVTLAGKHAEESILEKDLPIKYIGYSHCFRKEAGAYGKYSKGLYRVHQFRNLNIRYRTKDGRNEFVHMLNGTAIATSRTPLAILENYQEKDGSVGIPQVLQKYMGKDKITPK